MKYLKKYLIFESDSNNPEKSELDILSMEDYKKGDFHQAILNLGYFKWDKNENWSYTDVVNMLASKYHPEFKLMTLIGKYNQQVNNGGHSQYFENGYASGEGGAFSPKKGIRLHDDMIELFEKSKLLNMDKVCQEVLEIMKKFQSEMEDYDEKCDYCQGQGYTEEPCFDCDGSGSDEVEVDCPDCDGDGEIDDEDCSNCFGNGSVTEEEDCEYCDGSGESTHDCEYCEQGYVSPYIDNLDDEYYKISDKFMEICNSYSEKLINAVIIKPRNLSKKA